MSTSPQQTAPPAYKYDIALSFAEEDRKFAKCVARQLTKRNLKVYYDEDYPHDMLGENLYPMLDSIYRKESRHCLAFISKHYVRKKWTMHELNAAQARAFQNDSPYIFYFKFDDTEIPAVSGNVKVLHWDKYDCEKLAKFIYEKIQNSPDKTPQPLTPAISKPTIRFRKPINSLRDFFANPRKSFVTYISAGGLAILFATGRLMPIELLAHQLYEKSKEKVEGSLCIDSNFVSHTRGAGACSSHRGVKRDSTWFEYTKTLDECREEAKQISWLK